jgi:hypothetical protein
MGLVESKYGVANSGNGNHISPGPSTVPRRPQTQEGARCPVAAVRTPQGTTVHLHRHRSVATRTTASSYGSTRKEREREREREEWATTRVTGSISRRRPIRSSPAGASSAISTRKPPTSSTGLAASSNSRRTVRPLFLPLHHLAISHPCAFAETSMRDRSYVGV